MRAKTALLVKTLWPKTRTTLSKKIPTKFWGQPCPPNIKSAKYNSTKLLGNHLCLTNLLLPPVLMLMLIVRLLMSAVRTCCCLKLLARADQICPENLSHVQHACPHTCGLCTTCSHDFSAHTCKLYDLHTLASCTFPSTRAVVLFGLLSLFFPHTCGLTRVPSLVGKDAFLGLRQKHKITSKP